MEDHAGPNSAGPLAEPPEKQCREEHRETGGANVGQTRPTAKTAAVASQPGPRVAPSRRHLGGKVRSRDVWR